MRLCELSELKSIKVKAVEGNMLPIFHDGKKVKVTDKEAVELTIEKLSYESKVILCDAFNLNQVEEVKTKGAK